MNHKIKSFVIRQRTTKAQSRAIVQLSQQYVVNLHHEQQQIDQIFSQLSPIIIEIGFGMGDATWQIAKSNPELNYLAIDVHEAGVGALLLKIQEHEIKNIRIINNDAVAVCNIMIKPNSVFGFHIFCPDPWHKRRHFKRRLLQTDFIISLLKYLSPDGYIHIITDHECYKNFIKESIMSAIDYMLKTQAEVYFYTLYQDSPYNNRPATKFEQRALSKGGHIWDFIIQRQE
jgi:tRNA (guanine-N7-)-methyltransferase